MNDITTTIIVTEAPISVSDLPTGFNWLFDLILSLFESFSSFGIGFYNKASSLISSTISNGSFIYIVIGAPICFFLLKLLVDIIKELIPF